MSHTITITRLPDDNHDDAEFEIGGTCEPYCSVWDECPQYHRRPRNDEYDRPTFHGVEHLCHDIGNGPVWCVPTGECGAFYAYDLALEANRTPALGTYLIEFEWDGDAWLAMPHFDHQIEAEAGA